MDKCREILKKMPFSADVYEDYHVLVRGHRFQMHQIITQNQIPDTRFWDLFDDFCAAAVSVPDGTGSPQRGFISRGRDIIAVFVSDEGTLDGGIVDFVHDCEMEAFFAQGWFPDDVAYKLHGYLKRQEVHSEYDALWTCHSCGSQIYHTTMSMDKLAEVLK